MTEEDQTDSEYIKRLAEVMNDERLEEISNTLSDLSKKVEDLRLALDDVNRWFGI